MARTWPYTKNIMLDDTITVGRVAGCVFVTPPPRLKGDGHGCWSPTRIIVHACGYTRMILESTLISSSHGEILHALRGPVFPIGPIFRLSTTHFQVICTMIKMAPFHAPSALLRDGSSPSHRKSPAGTMLHAGRPGPRT